MASPYYGGQNNPTAKSMDANADGYYSGGSGGIYPGLFNYQSMANRINAWQPAPDDDLGRGLKLTEAFNWRGKAFDASLARAQAYDSAGLSMDLMNQASYLSRLEQSDARKEQFSYGMRSMDKQYELQNAYANGQYIRDVGFLDASGSQARKNMRELGKENRLQTITSGEQQRLGIAAQGQQDRMGYRVQGQENRAAIRTAGVENRMQAITEGEQQRLGIAATGQQERKTLSHEENLLAQREERHSNRARSGARAF